MAFRDAKIPFSTVLTSLGLTSGLKLCLDAGDAASYTSGQSWLDRSGNGYDFFRGANGTATTDDPTFNGSAGGLSVNEFFSFDGGDFFRYDTTNETWMNNLHKDGARYTIIGWINILSSANAQPVLANGQGLSTTVGIEFGASNTNTLRLRIGNGGGAFALTTETAATLSFGTWIMVSATVDEAAGTGFLGVDTTFTTFTSTYTSPSASNAPQTMEIGARANAANGIFVNGSKIAAVMVWEGVALTQAQVAAIYNAAGIAAAAGGFALTGIAASFKTTSPAAAASYALTGQAATFVGRLTTAVGTFAVTGQAALFSFNFAAAARAYTVAGDAAALTPKAIAGAGTYANNGVDARFAHTFTADAQSYTISWQTFSDASTLAANGTAFSLIGQGANLSYDIDLGGVGSGISGGTFSRGRWRELQEEEHRAREAAELARRRIEDAAREAAQRRASEQRAAIAARRAAEDKANTERTQLRAFEDAVDAFIGAQRSAAQLQGANALNDAAAAAQAQLTAEREEEEAIVHLLLVA